LFVFEHLLSPHLYYEVVWGKRRTTLEALRKEGMTIVNWLGGGWLGGGLVGGGAATAIVRGGGMGINKVVGMCTCSSCHNMLSSLFVTTTTTINTIATIDKILFGLFMLLILTPWDIVI